ncbi:hypothetical protein HK096_011640 [Nowakowskiella sp. JEL0078]|nr:hypothetical protein HK096_011640 [Nowakowskiella sp. JEL0078]
MISKEFQDLDDNQKLRKEAILKYIPIPSKQERKLQFGVDCAELVHFAHWEPGGEHIKQLVIKNVVMKTQKIKYKLPQTRYFSMEFPETITLSAGMSWTIPITFRPVAKEPYSDTIEFTSSFGKFMIPIKASLPEHILEFPNSVDFGMCPVRETAKLSFNLSNKGDLATYFSWEIPHPFRIHPISGILKSGSEENMILEFSPKDASVFSATCVCRFGSHQKTELSSQYMVVDGIGKYSHLSIDGGQTYFDFGEVFVGKSVEKKLILENPSALIFTPTASGMTCTDYYDITTLSGNTIRLTCTGKGIGPRVTFNTTVLNFNDVKTDTTVFRALYIQNHTATTAFYQV